MPGSELFVRFFFFVVVGLFLFGRVLVTTMSDQQGERSGNSTTPTPPSDAEVTPEQIVEQLANAAIIDHEIREEDKRFTVYKLELSSEEDSKLCVYHRYSEFRELYDRLKDKYPQVRFKFPGKRVFGKFDKDFIQSRKQGLQEFLQKITSPEMLADPDVQNFFLGNFLGVIFR